MVRGVPASSHVAVVNKVSFHRDRCDRYQELRSVPFFFSFLSAKFKSSVKFRAGLVFVDCAREKYSETLGHVTDITFTETNVQRAT